MVKNKKLIITIPKAGKLWKYSYGKSVIKRRELIPLVKRISKRLLASRQIDKTVLSVKDGEVVINQSCPSKNARYICWLLYAFLEDYLPRAYFIEKEKLYVGEEP